MDKIPVSLIVFSLRFIDPAALVEQVIQLFTWKPPGLHSLLQKVGGLICSEGRTEEQIKAFKQKIGHKRAAMLESLVTYGRVINEITMSDTAQRLEAIQSFSSEDLDGDDLEFIQLLIRLEEKTAFIDILAHQDVTALIRHCGHVFPPFLRQISKVGERFMLDVMCGEAMTQFICSMATWRRSCRTSFRRFKIF